MTRVDFYILADVDIEASLRFACHLGLKGFQSGHPVHIHVDDEARMRDVDQLMWSHPKDRFVPHACLGRGNSGVSGSDCTAPIHIGHGAPLSEEGLLINLSSEVPPFFGRFDRVAEVIVGATKTQGRDRYKYYRDRGYPLHHHDLDAWEGD